MKGITEVTISIFFFIFFLKTSRYVKNKESILNNNQSYILHFPNKLYKIYIILT